MPPTLKAGDKNLDPGSGSATDEAGDKDLDRGSGNAADEAGDNDPALGCDVSYEGQIASVPVTSDFGNASRAAWEEESAHSGFSCESPDAAPDVWVHIYNCDPYTGFLNKIALSHAEIGIYHAGIEVYGEEWSFQYFEDTWLDETVSGVVRCRPKQMPSYEYQESVHLGCTPLSKDEVDDILIVLYDQWPACSYHLTHRNCLLFAEHLADLLKTPGRFPDRLRGIIDASKKNSSVDAIVDYSWSWMKWWMVRKCQQDEPAEDRNHSRSRTEGSSMAEGGSCLWSTILNPSCTFCPGGTRRNLLETIALHEQTSDCEVRKDSGHNADIRYANGDAT